jgi:hypothetical protein
MNYNFTNGDNTLTLSYSTTLGGETHTMEVVFTKTSSGNNGDGDGDGDGDGFEYAILGSWKDSSSEYPTIYTYEEIWTFYANGTVKMVTSYSYDGGDPVDSIMWGDYSFKNGQLCINYHVSSFELCYDFEFSNNNNRFTLAYYSELSYTFTKL